MKSLFGGHETFHIREGWLRKGLLAVKEDPYVFSDPHAGDVLGVGHNMVTAIRYWLQATQLTDATREPRLGKKAARFELTHLASVILEHDPYFEDDGTLCVLHYSLATNRELATSWYWFFNVFGVRQFTQELFLSHLQRYVEAELRRKVKPRTLERDFRCLVRTYARQEERGRGASYEDSFDCPLAALNLIQHLPLTRTYRLQAPSRESLHPLLIGYALNEMRIRYPLLREQASLRDAQFEACSPGRVFGLESEVLYEYIVRLEKEHADLLAFSKTAGLNLIMFKPMESLEVLKRYYVQSPVAQGIYA